VVECGGLENRLARKGHGGSNPSSSASKLKTTLKLRRFFFRSKRANVRLFYHSFIPTVSKTVGLTQLSSRELENREIALLFGSAASCNGL
jgi:hypothetical protein